MSHETRTALWSSALSVFVAVATILGAVAVNAYYAGEFVAASEATRQDVAELKQKLSEYDVPGLRLDVNQLQKDVGGIKEALANCKNCNIVYQSYRN